MRRLPPLSSLHSLPCGLARPLPRTPLSRAISGVLLVLGLGALQAALTEPAHAQAADQSRTEQIEFSIAPGRLSTAIGQFGEQANVPITTPADLVQDKHTQGLQGRYDIRQGLETLLNGTGLRAERGQQGGYVLRAVPPPSITGLPTITVSAQKEETAFDPVQGYVARRSATATRTDTPINEIPQAITVISAQQVQDTGAQNLMDATRYTAGVATDIFGTDNRTDGIYARGEKLDSLEDGLRSILSQSSYAHDEPFAYERIEVLRGPVGMVGGSNPPGGILNLVSKRPREQAANEVFVQYGNHDTKKIGLDMTGPVEDEKRLLYRLIATGQDSGSQTDWAKRKDVYVKPMLTWNLDPSNSLTVYGEYVRNRMNTETPFLPYDGTLYDRAPGKIPSSIFMGEPEWDKTTGTRKRFGWEFKSQLSDNWELTHRFRHTQVDSHLLGMYANWWDGYFDEAGLPDANGEYLKRVWYERRYKIHMNSADVLMNGTFATGPLRHKLLLAANFDQVSTRQGSDEGDYPALNVYDPVYGAGSRPVSNLVLNKTKDKSWALTLQDQIRIADQLIVNLGLRYDKLYNYAYASSPKQKQQLDNYTKNIGVLWLAGHGLSPYISYSESFLPYYGMTKYDGSFLKPKEARQIAAGIKWRNPDETLTANVEVFRTKSKNVLTLDSQHAGYLDQAGEQKTQGFEVEFAARLQYWDIVAQYSYTKSETIKGDALTGSSVGVQTEGIPKHLASLWAVHDLASLGVPDLRIGAGVRYVGKVTNGLLEANGGVVVPSRTLFDAMASYDYKSFRFALNVNNLANKKYVSICESGGRCWYGKERTIVGSVSYKF